MPKNDDEAIEYLAVLNGTHTRGRPLFKDTVAVYVGRYTDVDHRQKIALRWRWVGFSDGGLFYEVEPW